MKKQRRKNGKIRMDIVFLCILVVICLLLLAVYIKREINRTLSSSNNLIIESDAHKPVPPFSSQNKSPFPLPSGKQVFSVSYGDKDPGKPKLTSIAMDPLPPTLGAKQTLTISITSVSPITEVTTTLMTDNKTVSFSPQLVRGAPTEGDWEASWVASDTTEKRYYLTFHVESTVGIRDDDITFR